MNTFSDTHAAIYEEPVDERIRKFLKLEKFYATTPKNYVNMRRNTILLYWVAMPIPVVILPIV